MTVQKHTFPQSGDSDYAENFSAHLGRSNVGDYVEEGMTFSNLSGTSADVSKGKAFIFTASSSVSDGSTRLNTVYTVHIPALTVSLTDTALNYIYLDPNLGTDDSATVTAYTNQSNAGANDLLIGTIDTNTSPPTTEKRNRNPDVEFDHVRTYLDLGIPVYDDVANAETGEGNIVYTTGSGPSTEGLWFHDGTSWEYSGIQSLRDADVDGVTGLIEDTSANRPAASSEGIIFFESDTGKVLYDDGTSWQNLGVTQHGQLAGVSPSDHHARYTDEEAQDAVNTLMSAGANINLTYDDTTNDLSVAVTQGATSGLDADLLDGVELANINWADTAMAQSDVNVSDLGAGDADLDLSSFDLLNATNIEAEYGSLIQGTNPRETITETTSPASFNFSGSSARDIHGGTDVTISNGSTASATENITVELYDGVDTTGTLVSNQTKSVTVAAGGSKTVSFIPTDQPLDTGTYHIEITQSGTTLSIDQTDEHTKGARYTLDQTATGGLFLDNQDGSRVLEIDAISEDLTLSTGDLLDGAGNVIYDQSAGHVPEAQLDLANVTWADTAMAQSDVNVSDLGAADASLNMSGNDVNNVNNVHFNNTEFTSTYHSMNESELAWDNSEGLGYYHDGAFRTILSDYHSMTQKLDVRFNVIRSDNGMKIPVGVDAWV